MAPRTCKALAHSKKRMEEKEDDSSDEKTSTKVNAKSSMDASSSIPSSSSISNYRCMSNDGRTLNGAFLNGCTFNDRIVNGYAVFSSSLIFLFRGLVELEELEEVLLPLHYS